MRFHAITRRPSHGIHLEPLHQRYKPKSSLSLSQERKGSKSIAHIYIPTQIKYIHIHIV